MHRQPDHDRTPQLDLEEVRRRLESAQGPQFWRSLEELAATPEFEALLEREFPQQASELPEGVDRRRFLQLAAASLALGGLTACTRQPTELIVPYIEQPESLVPGKPVYFASTMQLDGYARPILVESHMARPTKIEGNPEHPASRGSADLFAQASILEMYDPERSQVVRNLGRIRTWNAFADEMRHALQALTALGNARIRILTRTVTSPSLGAMIEKVLATHPEARWHQYTANTRDHGRRGIRNLFGRFASPRYRLGDADVVVSLDADFLTSGPDGIANARGFASRRRVAADGERPMSRLYMAEATPTTTGTLADHRLPASVSDIERLTTHLAVAVGVPGASASGELHQAQRNWVAAAAADLRSHAGRSLVLPGDYAAAEIHTLAHAINTTLGNAGATVDYIEPVEARPEIEIDSLRTLVEDMAADQVDILLILGCNPVFDAPSDLHLKAAMDKVRTRIHLATYEDETSDYCQWHLPEAHYLESWSDARAFDGSVCFTQPLIEPLFNGRTAAEVLSLFAGDGQPMTALDWMRSYWQSHELAAGSDFETLWRRWLHDGFIGGSEAGPIAVAGRPEAVANACSRLAATVPAAAGIELVFRPDPTIYDGQFNNNGWLQECPKPLTKLTWDNALLLAPATAQSLGVANGQMVEIRVGDRTSRAPAWLMPGHPTATATLHLGYGRWKTGKVGSGTGFDAYPLRTSDRLWTARDASLSPDSYELASTQLHSNIELESEESEKRHLVRVGSIQRFEEEPDFVHHMGHATGPTRACIRDGTIPATPGG